VKLFLLLMDEVAMLLARYALFDKGVAVYLHGWPKVDGAKDSGGHRSCARVISTYAFVQFFYYVLGLFGCDTFEDCWPYPRLYKSSPIIVYLTALASQLLLAL